MKTLLETVRTDDEALQELLSALPETGCGRSYIHSI